MSCMSGFPSISGLETQLAQSPKVFSMSKPVPLAPGPGMLARTLRAPAVPKPRTKDELLAIEGADAAGDDLHRLIPEKVSDLFSCLMAGLKPGVT